MMRDCPFRRLLLSVVMLLAAPVSAYSQRPEAEASARTESRQKSVSYSFISPNTRENLKLEEAIRLLNSREESQLVNSISHLSRCLRLNQTVSRAVGSWSDGAEHSTISRTFTDEQTLRYEDARLGKLERQKSVLYFRRNSSGASVMYILNTLRGRASLSSISKTLDQNGVEFRSLVPQPKRRTIIYVVDLKSDLHNQVAAAAKELRARLISIKGDGEFIGDDADREKAQQVFALLIKEFEDAHPQVARQCAK
ncbi:MAG TPA: hypothetical protein VF779_16175 [Pyrinomonadaceae bacterium]